MAEVFRQLALSCKLGQSISGSVEAKHGLELWGKADTASREKLLKAYLDMLKAAGAPEHHRRPLHEELARRPTKDLGAAGAELSCAARRDRRHQRP